MDYFLLTAGFFAIALLYSAAGFGGGSSYLALLSLSAIPAGAIRPIALLCNLVVTAQASFAFARAAVTPIKRALPLLFASIPAAFYGGRVQLPREQYLLLLGALLTLAGLLMLLWSGKKAMGGHRGADAGAIPTDRKQRTWVPLVSLVTGGLVGFLSGVVGIGGGIFLSPILFLTRWDSPRAIAATTSLFIMLNSLAGLVGQLSVGISLQLPLTALLVVAVTGGGWLGTRLTLRRLPPATIEKIAAVLILFVGLRLIWSNLLY